MRLALLVMMVSLLGLGCARGGALPSDESRPADSSSDTGSVMTLDAGTAASDARFDAGLDAIDDAGVVSMDTGATDAMSLPDVGVAPRDAGVRDAGAIDAGFVALDAGSVTSDAGSSRSDASAMCTESETRVCATACSSEGRATCSAGVFGACVPPVEACNRIDDDCDMEVDEGVQVQIFDAVPFAELRAAHARCDGPYGSLVNCMSAAKRWCGSHASGCFNGGAGHLQTTDTSARVACFGHLATERMTTFSDLSAVSGFSISSGNAGSRLAQSAANRYCRSLSYEAGMGPVEFSNPNVWVTCLPSELAAQTTVALSELTVRGCNPNVSAGTLGCQAAADLECRELGYQGGYGPVEWNHEISVIVCFR